MRGCHVIAQSGFYPHQLKFYDVYFLVLLYIPNSKYRLVQITVVLGRIPLAPPWATVIYICLNYDDQMIIQTTKITYLLATTFNQSALYLSTYLLEKGMMSKTQRGRVKLVRSHRGVLGVSINKIYVRPRLPRLALLNSE